MSNESSSSALAQTLTQRGIRAIVVGTSAGGLDALFSLLGNLPRSMTVPIAFVLHISAEAKNMVPTLLRERTRLTVKEAESGESIEDGVVYMAPPDYHLSVEPDFTFSLSSEEPVQFSRPSIDLLFESAARAFGPSLASILLTGANDDGTRGTVRVKEHGGLTVVQEPTDAAFGTMPLAAVRGAEPEFVLPLQEIAGALLAFAAAGESR